jgi:hypothetical protein
MAIDVSIISASMTVDGNLPPDWVFSFTTGYGAWALAGGYRGLGPVGPPEIPWEVVLEIRYNSGDSFFRHKQIGDHHHLRTDYSTPFECKGMRLYVWTKTQSLYINESGFVVLRKFPWEQPHTYLCAIHALGDSGYYDSAQLEFLGIPFDDPEWAGKGDLCDDQTFFDAWVPSQMLVYHGYWKDFMDRFVNFIKQRDLLLIRYPRITDQTRFSIEGHISSDDRNELMGRMEVFFSSEFQLGIFSTVPREAVEEFHRHLPQGIREWIERRRA